MSDNFATDRPESFVLLLHTGTHKTVQIGTSWATRGQRASRGCRLAATNAPLRTTGVSSWKQPRRAGSNGSQRATGNGPGRLDAQAIVLLHPNGLPARNSPAPRLASHPSLEQGPDGAPTAAVRYARCQLPSCSWKRTNVIKVISRTAQHNDLIAFGILRN